MALQDLLNLSASHKKIGLSEERVRAIIPVARQYISFWRDYPDLFVDFMAKVSNSNFKFYFYQRIFLRCAARHQYLYACFPRAYSKSFLSNILKMVQGILYPRAKLFSCAGGKAQSSSIMKEKVNEICELIPTFGDEIKWGRGRDSSVEGKDYCCYNFKGGAFYDNIAIKDSSRGKRRNAGTMEEMTLADGKLLSEVIIPIMNISRKCANGLTDPNEVLNKSQVYVGTAGYKSTFAYEKLIQILVWQIVKPERAIVLGGTYRIPVLVKLLDKNFIKELKADGSFSDSSFEREYESKWSGTTEDAFFSSEVFDKSRVIKQPHLDYHKPAALEKNSFYIVSVDVGRKGCDSVACIFKILPQKEGASIKQLVNIETMGDAHFEDQAIWLKRLFYRYNAQRLVIDGNGLGIGLLDYLVKTQKDSETNETLPDFGVINDKDNEYKQYRTPLCQLDAIYIIKANPSINTDAYINVQNQLASNKVKVLIDERSAKAMLLETKVGQMMRPEDRTIYLQPFMRTSMLKEEMMNLQEEREGINIKLKRANRKIPKDKFSAFMYGLYYIKEELDSKKRRHKKLNVKSFMFMN